MMDVDVMSTNDARWRSIIDGLPHDIYHMSEYLKSEDAFRGDSSRLVIVSDAESYLFVPLTFREIPGGGGSVDASSPYGYPAPLATPEADADWLHSAIEALVAHLESIGVVSLFLRFHPLMGVPPSAFSKFGAEVEHGETVYLGLARPFDEVRNDMRKGHRYDVRKALKEGQSAEWDEDWFYFEEFLNIYQETMSRVGASEEYLFSREYFESLRDDLRNFVHLWISRVDGEIAAASLITECDGIVQYHLSGTRSEFLKRNPTKVLLDEVARWANERGDTRFHLGGGVGTRDDSLFRFKAGFSNLRGRFSTVRIIVNEERFSELVNRVGVVPSNSKELLSGFFPPYRRSH